MARLLSDPDERSKRPRSKTSEIIEEGMDAVGVDIRWLAQNAHITYEHARRIVRGEAVPSNVLLGVVANLLQLDLKTLERASMYDRINYKYNGLPVELAGKNPEFEPFERVLAKLTPQQRKDLLNLATSWAKANKQHERTGV